VLAWLAVELVTEVQRVILERKRTMRIKKKNVARLASLSALGAGALGVAAGTAKADIVSMPLNDKVGFSPGFGSGATIQLRTSVLAPVLGSFKISARGPGIPNFGTSHTKFGGTRNRFFSRQYLRFNAYYHAGNVKFWEVSGVLGIFGPGKKWNTAGGNLITSRGNIASRSEWKFTTSALGPKTVQKFKSNGSGYALFTFSCPAGSCYGWLELSDSVTANSGPDVTLEGLAFDTSGAYITTPGGAAAVPEPSAFELTGLVALVLGATGLRRWRAARKPAA
jgi:hypothetical protein